MTFLAKWAQKCNADCDAGIKPDDEVQYDLTDNLVHVECPEGEDVLVAERPVCRGCWQVVAVNGECGC